MKKIVLSIGFVALVTIILFSCSKNAEIKNKLDSDIPTVAGSTSNSNLDIAYNLASNQDFADFVKSYYTNSVAFYNALNERGIYNNSTIESFAAAHTLEDFQNLSNNYSISFDLIQETYSDPLARFAYFLKRSDLYSSLSKDEMIEVVNNVFNVVLKDENYIKEHPNSPLLHSMNEIVESVNTQNAARGITTTEALQCVVAAAGAFIAENWSAIKNLVGILQGESLSFGVVKAAAQLFFPEVKGIWTVCTLVGCLIGAALN